MDFFDELMNYFEDESIRDELMDMLMPTMSAQGDQKMITAHMSDTGEIVFSVFDMEEWKMLTEMSYIIDKPIDDIIKDLGPDDVLQLYVRPDQGPIIN
jgi:hypothetical protein